MKKTILNIFAVFILTILGIVIWQAVLLPQLVSNPRLERFFFAKMLAEREVNVFPKEEIIIEENQALVKRIEKAEKVVVGIRIKTVQGNFLEGSGLVLTSDGLIIALADIVPQGSVVSVWVDNEKVAFEIIKRDLEQNLALIRIDKQGLATAGFADLSKIKKGQRVFLVGAIFLKDRLEKVSNEGVIRYFEQNFISTNIFENQALAGSALFDTDGNVLGINTIENDGRVFTIPVSKIQDLAGLL